jgi:hypothetical protein
MRFGDFLNIGLYLVALQERITTAEAARRFADEIGYSEFAVQTWKRDRVTPDELCRVAQCVIEFCHKHDRFAMASRLWARELLASTRCPDQEQVLTTIFGIARPHEQVALRNRSHLSDADGPPAEDEDLLPESDALVAYLCALHQSVANNMAGQAAAYLCQTGRLLQRLAALGLLLTGAHRLSEREKFTIMAAAYVAPALQPLLRPQPAEAVGEQNVLPRSLEDECVAGEKWLLAHLLTERWSPWTGERLAAEWGLKVGWDRQEVAAMLALICTAARRGDLAESGRLAGSGDGRERVRPALLAALLALANLIAEAATKPDQASLEALGDAPAPEQVRARLRAFLQEITITHGHIRFHYRLPPNADPVAVGVLLSGPAHQRLRAVRDVLTRYHLVPAIDSIVEISAEVEPLPEGLLREIQVLAGQELQKLLPAMLGTPPPVQDRYPFTGVRMPVLAWPSLAGAGPFSCMLFALEADEARLVESWDTTEPVLVLPVGVVRPGTRYQWVARANDSKQWQGGIFWLLDEEMLIAVDRQLAWYQNLEPVPRRLMQARVLARYGLFAEAEALLQEVEREGDALPKVQAQWELIGLYHEMHWALKSLGLQKAADQYLEAAQQVRAALATSAQPGVA